MARKESLFHRISLGWLGIRGIGSLNYIAYAWVHGLAGSEASRMVDIAITVVTLSVFIHGISVTPLLTLRRNVKKTSKAVFSPGSDNLDFLPILVFTPAATRRVFTCLYT
jgi:NhaP-type Na+/H+ or K+/H+ antiporter